MKQCPQCRRTFTDDNRFCLEDGTTLILADLSATVDYSSETPTVVVPKFQTPPQFVLPQTSAQTQTNSTAKWVYPVLGLLLGAVVVLGFLVIYQLTKRDGNIPANTNKETPKPSETTSPTKTQATIQPTQEKQLYDSDNGKYPEGSTRYLTESDINGKSDWDLRIMRNEIFARHGRKFKNAELRNYFMNQTWYSPQFDEVSLTETEKRNVEFLKNYE